MPMATCWVPLKPMVIDSPALIACPHPLPENVCRKVPSPRSVVETVAPQGSPLMVWGLRMLQDQSSIRESDALVRLISAVKPFHQRSPAI